MKLPKFSEPWVRTGLMIFPVILLLGLFLGAASGGRISYLFWLILPSIVFEQLFEICCYGLSNMYWANLLFAVLFWFGIGAATGWLSSKIRS